ncbi:hypothetical protein [Salinirubrum litoreum]|uniref:Uncharacterized protein n=1 Tax=Salinirubrum litoreum TaxID=1126234 RepID=A0ABD5R739_9EURY|nr:hypothetical protein [Salinirubrum litoreum]
MVPAALPRYRPVSLPAAPALTARLAQVALAVTILAGPTRADGILLPHYGLAVLLLPDALDRVTGVSLPPAHRLWIAGGIALHPFGALYGYYDTVWWWDHLAHAASASLLAAGLYACWLAVGRLRTGGDTLPKIGVAGHLAVFALVLSGGVGWEVFEAHTTALVVYGPTDTRLDLVFDVVGWALLAPVARRVVGDVPAGLARRFGGGTDDRQENDTRSARGRGDRPRDDRGRGDRPRDDRGRDDNPRDDASKVDPAD